MGLAGPCASRAVILGEETHHEAGGAISTLGSAAFGDGPLRLAELAGAGETFNGIDFLAGERGQHQKATVDRAVTAAAAIGGSDEKHGASPAFPFRAALF